MYSVEAGRCSFPYPLSCFERRRKTLIRCDVNACRAQWGSQLCGREIIVEGRRVPRWGGGEGLRGSQIAFHVLNENPAIPVRTCGGGYRCIEPEPVRRRDWA